MNSLFVSPSVYLSFLLRRYKSSKNIDLDTLACALFTRTSRVLQHGAQLTHLRILDRGRIDALGPPGLNSVWTIGWGAQVLMPTCAYEIGWDYNFSLTSLQPSLDCRNYCPFPNALKTLGGSIVCIVGIVFVLIMQPIPKVMIYIVSRYTE